MDEGDDNTVIRSRALPAVDPTIPDDDTIIRERAPSSDRPSAVLDAVARPAADPSEPFPLVEPNRGRASAAAVDAPSSPLAGRRPPSGDDVSRGTPVHRFRINGHEPIGLDLPAIIGRKPSAPRISSGRLARLVRVPSPLREVSSTHLELRQHGASVIVTDLKSTNGTIVAIPGFSAQKLRQGESVVVSAGTVVDIGDGNLVEILPVERIAPAGG